MEIIKIPINEMEPNEWNPNRVDPENMAKLRADIKRAGFMQPIVVRKTEKNKWQIVDGYHRWTVLKELGYSEAPCIEISIHDLNKTMTLDDLEAALPYEKAELQDDLALLKLPQDIDKVVEVRAEKERKAEPIFISATIYKDKEKGLHEFIEQAMLEGEATFCEIKIKVECPSNDYDMIIKALQNIAKLDRGEDELDGENAPVVTRFAMFPEQLHVVDQALQHVITTQGYMKNPRGMALEMICADYLAGAADLGGEVDG